MPEVTISIDGRAVTVPSGISVAAAIERAGITAARQSVVRREPRAPLCGMGICFECRVTVDGQAHRLSCRTICADGMRVETR